MSRIKLRELLNFTEQAPQPPETGQPAPTPTPAPGQSPTPDAPAPETTEPPSPEDPGEYDFTRDFKNFESTIEKTKQSAKKKFLDRMNQMVKDKKVTVNASRGYGQPQKDYTIDKVSKASVDWYYNKNVVVLTDGNGKEYFLTPGVNIKMEAPAAPEPETPEGQPADQAPKEPPKPAKKAPQAGGEQPAPGGTPPSSAGGPPPPTQKPGQEPAPGGIPPISTPDQKEPAPEENPLKKKKPAPAPPMEEDVMEEADRSMTPEIAERDYYEIFSQFIPLQHGQSRIDIKPFFKGGKFEGGGEYWSSEARFEIPANILGSQFDPKDFKLEYKNEARHYGGPGQSFSRGSVDVTRHGRFWVFEFWNSGGLDI